MASAVNAVSVAAPSAADISRNFSEAKSLRSSDFGGGRAKNGCSRGAYHPSDVHVALGGGAAFAIERLAHGAENVVVEQRVARPGIAGDQRIGAVDIGDVGDAADIDHDQRPLPLQQLGKRAMIDRDKGCTLPTRGDIGGTKSCMTGMWIAFASALPSPIWHSHFLRRAGAHGLAVKADNIDVSHEMPFCAVKAATARMPM